MHGLRADTGSVCLHREALQAALSQKRKPEAPAQPASKAQRVYLQDDALDEDLSSSGSEQEVALAT